MDDLHARLKAAVEARLTLARAASGTPTGEHWRWECNNCDATLDVTPVTVLDEYLECPNCEGSTVALRSVEEYPTASVGPLPHFVVSYAAEQRPVDAVHIAANDPATVIRMCERDLRVLERHQSGVGPDGPSAGEPVCFGCSQGAEWYYAPWPCDEIADMATAYGIAGEGGGG